MMIVVPAPTTLPPWFAPALQFAGALFGACVGGVVTWLTAGRKLAKERAFDRQLEWHESMHRALTDGASEIRRALSLYASSPTPAAMSELLSAVTPIYAKVREHTSDALLFASPDIVLRLNHFSGESLKSFESFSDRLQGEPKDQPASAEILHAVAKAIEALHNDLVGAMMVVGASHREHLNLPKLPTSAFPPGKSLFPNPPDDRAP